MLKANFQKGLFTVIVGIALWFCPMPAGVDAKAWHMFAIFVATIIGFILHPIPIGGVALIAVGLFISSVTESTALAAGLCFVVLLINYMISSLTRYLPTSAYASYVCFLVFGLLMALVNKVMLGGGKKKAVKEVAE